MYMEMPNAMPGPQYEETMVMTVVMIVMVVAVVVMAVMMMSFYLKIKFTWHPIFLFAKSDYLHFPSSPRCAASDFQAIVCLRFR
jgi:E3 ubiquitin-protein ligase DOA10